MLSSISHFSMSTLKKINPHYTQYPAGNTSKDITSHLTHMPSFLISFTSRTVGNVSAIVPELLYPLHVGYDMHVYTSV